MPRFFLSDINPDSPVITGEDARHILRSLRMQPGEKLILCDGQGTDYFCEITGADSGNVTLRCLDIRQNDTEPKTKLTLFQCLPKGEKLEDIIKRAVELGIYEIVPVLSSRCVSRPDNFLKKRVRLQKIAKEAAMQSGRGIIPRIGELVRFDAAVKEASSFERTLLFYEGTAEPLSGVLRGDERAAALIIGPEGGFEPAEVAASEKEGIKTVTMGKRILRCETAAVTAVALTLFLTGNMG